MIRVLLSLALAAMLVAAAPNPSAPRGAAVDVALGYVRALGSGNYPMAYAMLSRGMQRYFGNLDNYASVWKADRFSAGSAQLLKIKQEKGVQLVTIRETVSYFDHGAQLQRKARITVPFAVTKESGAYRVDDEGHPYRSFLPSGASVERDGTKLVVRKIAFFLRRIEWTIAFENDGKNFITFLPYGRTVLHDQTGVYRPWVTRDWLLTDRQLFLGLRLAPLARYTGQINFQVGQRLDDRERTYTLTVAPALREGADEPVEFALPPIAVPAP